MAERKRRYFDVIDGDGDKGAAQNPGPMPLRVGDILRNRREELGYDLPGMAKNLRIRLPYLEAIEQCRYGDLPGQAYVTGFLRTYALALGLDAGPLLRRYKEETANVPQTTELYFPEPVNENRVPAGAVMLIAALLAGLAYAGWYVMSSSDRGVADLVPPLPERLSKLIHGEQTAPAAPAPAGVLAPGEAERLVGQSQPTAPEVGAPTAQPPAQPASPPPITPPPISPPAAGPDPAAVAAQPVPAQSVPVPSVPGETAGREPGAVAQTAPPPSLPPPSASSVAPSSMAPSSMAPSSAVPSSSATLSGTLSATTAGAPPPAGPAAEEEESELPPIPDVTGRGPGQGVAEAGAGAPTVSAPTVTEPALSTTTPSGGRVFGQTTGPARVVVRAVEQSWIEVRDGKGTLWASRVLRPGDEFRAPDVPGLTMTTGNAGGVSVSVDGRELPPLGEKGRVVRDVSLVPADLERR